MAGFAVCLAIAARAQTNYSPAYTFSTYAGYAGIGFTDGPTNVARFDLPQGIAIDAAHNLYIADLYAYTIRKITPDGIVTTLAGTPGVSGSADGKGGAARFADPMGIAVDTFGNLYVADLINCTIRKIDQSGNVTTLAGLARTGGTNDGVGSSARFMAPLAVAVDGPGNIFVADMAYGKSAIRKVTPGGVVTTLARLAYDGPWYAGLAVDTQENVYLVEYQGPSHGVRKITPAGVVSQFAGTQDGKGADGIGTQAGFEGTAGIAIDGQDNLYVTDTDLGTIRKITPATVVTTLAGMANYSGRVDGVGNAVRFNGPRGLAVDKAGNLFVEDSGNNVIRQVAANGAVTTFAGPANPFTSVDGVGSAAQFNYPWGVATDAANNIYVADTGSHVIRKTAPDGTVTTVAGLVGSFGSDDGTGSNARFTNPKGITLDGAGNIYVTDGNYTVRMMTPGGTVTTIAGLAGSPGSADGTGSSARFGNLAGIVVDGSGNIFVADTGNHTIRQIAPGGVVSTLAGLAGTSGNANGTNSAARFDRPMGLALDYLGNIYVADSDNGSLRQVTPAGVVTTRATGFNIPIGVAVDRALNVYVSDTQSHGIRKVATNGTVTRIAGLTGQPGFADGGGLYSQFDFPYGLAMDSATNIIVADYQNSAVRRVTPGGVVTTIAGAAPAPNSKDGPASSALFNHPFGVSLDNSGNIFVADTFNDTIRKINPQGVTSTLAGMPRSGGNTDGTGSAARFDALWNLAADNSGNVFAIDNHCIRQITAAGVVTTLAGNQATNGSVDATGLDARFNHPYGIAVDNAGKIYVADTSNNTVRVIAPGGVVSTLAGVAGVAGNADGTGTNALFNGPTGVAVDGAGTVFVADSLNYTIRKISAGGVVTTLAGTPGVTGYADGPGSIAVDGDGNIYVADASDCTIRFITPAGVVTTLGGVRNLAGIADGTGSAARFGEYSSNLQFNGLAVDAGGTVYLADSESSTIRKGVPSGSIAPPVLQLPTLVNGQFGFGITGFSNLSLNIESSTDLLNWQFSGSYNLVGGTNYFVEPDPVAALRFYRAHVR